MAKAIPDWFLIEWMETTQIIAADLVRETGWTKSKVSDLINGKQPYKRDIINELSRVLHLRPYELLMHPTDANAFKRIKDNAAQIVSGGTNEELDHRRVINGRANS